MLGKCVATHLRDERQVGPRSSPRSGGPSFLGPLDAATSLTAADRPGSTVWAFDGRAGATSFKPYFAIGGETTRLYQFVT